jgi:hypothetical protein
MGITKKLSSWQQVIFNNFIKNNMKKSEDISRKVEETLGLVDRIQKVEARPYFYTRLVARMEKAKEHTRQPLAVKKIQYAFYGLVLLLAINGYSMYKLLPLRLTDKQAPSMETFIENYQLDVSNIYTFTENDIH